ncbi:SiaB family protein kinase [Ammoniphilus sp. YIM 78166]|uniref:SiaB family protein kinase n=1 Tax=Ammoniphilus sp. YIM 78166 TaxID=1644106 RepID=UPI00196A916A|nr:SiaB family protein kinase [Ammoniphilus sp. YIM 78166]
MNDSLLDIQNRMRANGLLICFSGKFTQAIIEELGEAVRKYLEMEESPSNDIFNIFSIFIEQTQNIRNYCTSKEGSDVFERVAHSCIVTIGKTEAGNIIQCGNLIEEQDIPALVQRIEPICHMDRIELKKYYKQKLREELPEGSTSAGMGFIEIARKSSQPIEYSMFKVDESFSYFTLQAIV